MNSKRLILLKERSERQIGCQLRKIILNSFLCYTFFGVSHVIYSTRNAGKQYESLSGINVLFSKLFINPWLQYTGAV